METPRSGGGIVVGTRRKGTEQICAVSGVASSAILLVFSFLANIQFPFQDGNFRTFCRL